MAPRTRIGSPFAPCNEASAADIFDSGVAIRLQVEMSRIDLLAPVSTRTVTVTPFITTDTWHYELFSATTAQPSTQR